MHKVVKMFNEKLYIIITFFNFSYRIDCICYILLDILNMLGKIYIRDNERKNKYLHRTNEMYN